MSFYIRTFFLSYPIPIRSRSLDAYKYRHSQSNATSRHTFRNSSYYVLRMHFSRDCLQRSKGWRHVLKSSFLTCRLEISSKTETVIFEESNCWSFEFWSSFVIFLVSTIDWEAMRIEILICLVSLKVILTKCLTYDDVIQETVGHLRDGEYHEAIATLKSLEPYLDDDPQNCTRSTHNWFRWRLRDIL